MLDNLSFIRIEARYRVHEPVQLPPFSGSALRGALGHALRKVRCGRSPACSRCSIRPACRYGNLYLYLFESPCDHPMIEPFHAKLNPRMRRETYPQPFVLAPPEGGEYRSGSIFRLPLVLIGKAVACLPFVVCALTAMGANGIGKGRGRIGLEKIVGLPADNGERIIYDGASGQMVGPAEVTDLDAVQRWAGEIVASRSKIEEVHIRFVTPFRYKYQDRLGQPLTFEILMRNLLRRMTLLSVHSPIASSMDHRDLLSLAAAVQVKRSSLKWHRWERYSARQNGYMSLDGFIGEIVFCGDLTPFLLFLKLGELLNVGKDGSFGLGKYRLSFPAAPAPDR